LFYYKSQKQKTPTGVILLKNTQVKKDSGKKFTFLVTGQHLKRSYEIVAKNEPDMENWIRELQNVINKSTNTSIDKEDKKENDSEKKKESDEIFSSEKDSKKKVGLDDFDLLCVVGRGSFGKVMKVKKKKVIKKFLCYENFRKGNVNETKYDFLHKI